MPSSITFSGRHRLLRGRAVGNLVPLDLTPMIDCVFLLLIFFILTTKFTPDDLQIAALMPTGKGQIRDASIQPIPPQEVAISIYPAGLFPGHQPRQYGLKYGELRAAGAIDRVAIRVGGDEPLVIDGARLSDPQTTEAEIDRVHAHLRQALATRETGVVGEAQPPITIHCFSGLPWKYALLAYDSVRDYERAAGRGEVPSTAAGLRAARAVDFAPPRVRHHGVNELGDELFEILHRR